MTTGAKVFGLPIDTRFRRRAVVAAVYGSYIGVCVFGGYARNNSGAALITGVLFTALAGLVLCAGWLALAVVTREYGFPGDSRMFISRDERQTGVRHRSFVRAYWILTVLLCSGVVYGTLAVDAGLWMPDPQYRKPLLFGLMLLCTSLPSAIIAWTEPDEGADAAELEHALTDLQAR